MALTPEQIAAAEAQILEAMSDPELVTTDAGTVKMHSLSSQLAALRELKAIAAAPTIGTSALGGLRISKAIPPGAA